MKFALCIVGAGANECVAAGGRLRHTKEVKKQGVLRPLQGKQDDYASEGHTARYTIFVTLFCKNYNPFEREGRPLPYEHKRQNTTVNYAL